MDQVAHAPQHAVDSVGETARQLLHPSAVRLANDAGDLDTSRLDADDEEDVLADQAGERENLDGEEVGGGDCSQMDLEETSSTASTCCARARVPRRARGGCA